MFQESDKNEVKIYLDARVDAFVLSVSKADRASPRSSLPLLYVCVCFSVVVLTIGSLLSVSDGHNWLVETSVSMLVCCMAPSLFGWQSDRHIQCWYVGVWLAVVSQLIVSVEIVSNSRSMSPCDVVGSTIRMRSSLEQYEPVGSFEAGRNQVLCESVLERVGQVYTDA